MTTKEWIDDTNKVLAFIKDPKNILPIIQPTHNAQVQRIFDKGNAGDGNKIGHYSDKKTGLYVNPNFNIGSFSGQGKNGEKTFKDGRAHKTKYFDNYKAYRNAVQKETSFVNLRMTENFKIDYSNSLRFVGGRVTSSVNSKQNVDKLNGALKKYGNRTFELTKEEQQKLTERFAKKLTENLRRD